MSRAKKPCKQEIDIIKSGLNKKFLKDNMHKHLTYNQIKHVIYIWMTLNNLETLYISERNQSMIKVITMHMGYFVAKTMQVKLSNID